MKGSFYSALALALATFLPFPHVHAGTVIESGGLMGVTVPTDVDIAQCQNRRVFKADGFVLGDSPFGEGCVLNDTERFLTYNLDRTEATNFTSPLVAWTLEVKRPARNDLVVGIVSPRKRPLFYCFARGQLGRATVPEFLQNGLPAEGSQSEIPTQFASIEKKDELHRRALKLRRRQDDSSAAAATEEDSVNNGGFDELGNGNEQFIMDIAFFRSMDLPSRFNSKIDKGIMQYILNVKNVPFSPYDSESLPFYPNYQFSQQVLIIWLDGKDQSLGTTNTTIFDAFNGIEWTEEVPAGARKAALTFFTDYPYYSVGQISMMVYQQVPEFKDAAKKIFDVAFIIALVFVAIVPVLLILDDIVILKRTPSLRIVDLVHVQGPRYIRAVIFTVVMALLYFIFQWVRATKPREEGNLLPVFNGIEAAFFVSKPGFKTVKTLVFIGMFVACGLIFWPLFLCYAHASDGSWRASLLGLLVSANLIVLRFCLEYINILPYKGYDRKIVQEIPEVVAYVSVLVYFTMNTVSSGFFETHYRKTYFKDVIHVRSLLRKVSLAPGIMAKDSSKPSMFSFLQKVDNRPIWLRGRKPLSTFQQMKIFFTSFRMPVRLMAAICMMTLFTYFVLVAQLYMLLDKNAQLSCVLGMFGEGLIQIFSIASGLAGQFTGTQNFGAGLADTLADLSSQIKDQVGGTVVDDMFDMLLGSVVSSMILSGILLVYNIFDFCLNVRKDLGKLRKGDYSRIDDYGAMATANAVQFMGTQIGFAYMGSLYLMTILLIINFMLALFIKYAFFRDLVWKFILQNGLFFVSLAVSIILSMAQKFIVEAFFVAKLVEKPEEHPDAENVKTNAKGQVVISTKFWLVKSIGYNQIDYFFLFPNLITGLLSFLATLIKMIMGSALFAYRLDKKTEYTIPFLGSKSAVYFSWILQEHHHTNPVLLVFLKLIGDWHKHEKTSIVPASSTELRRRRIVNKWLVAYTLVNNPSLARYRKAVVRDTYLAEYIAHTEAPLLREQELQRVRAETDRLQQTQLRDREVAIWNKARESGFGRQAVGKLNTSSPTLGASKAPQPYAMPGSTYDVAMPAVQASSASYSPKQQQSTASTSPQRSAPQQSFPQRSVQQQYAPAPVAQSPPRQAYGAYNQQPQQQQQQYQYQPEYQQPQRQQGYYEPAAPASYQPSSPTSPSAPPRGASRQ